MRQLRHGCAPERCLQLTVVVTGICETPMCIVSCHHDAAVNFAVAVKLMTSMSGSFSRSLNNGEMVGFGCARVPRFSLKPALLHAL